MAAVRSVVAFACACALLGPRAASSQDAARTQTLVQLRLVNEVRSDRSNVGAAAAPDGQPASWATSDYGLATLDGSWTSAGSRLRLGGAAALMSDSGSGSVHVRLREAYVRLSAAGWLDVEAGKRILKWGTGYAFTPTGVLDPPRDPSDPRDRLGTNEGIVFAGAHVYRGNTALSIVGASPDTWRSTVAGAPHWVAAARLRTLVRGVEVAVVGSVSDATAPSWGVNFTHVVGQNLEWHGELLVHRRVPPALPVQLAAVSRDSGGDRDVSALIGCQYTFNVGVNVVLEYYHDANGLDRGTWLRLINARPSPTGTSVTTRGAALSSGTTSTTPLPGLRHFAFLRVAPAATEPRLLPELLAIAGLDDGSLTLVPGLTWTAQRHLQVYVRGTVLSGPTRSVARSAASSGGLQVGAGVRF